MSTQEKAESTVYGYLPNEAPPFGQMVLLGLQHVLTMFPATVLVALLVGFDVGAVLTVSGVATLVALVLSKVWIGSFIPLYYGSSFSYIAATLTLTGASYGVYAGDAVRLAQVGIVATGIVNILVGFVILRAGKEFLDKILPPVLTGMVALVIDADGELCTYPGILALLPAATSLLSKRPEVDPQRLGQPPLHAG